MIRLTIEERIKECGLKKGYVARQIGVDPDTLANWMNNRSFPKLNQAVKLADILRCEITDLYDRNDKND